MKYCFKKLLQNARCLAFDIFLAKIVKLRDSG